MYMNISFSYIYSIFICPELPSFILRKDCCSKHKKRRKSQTGLRYDKPKKAKVSEIDDSA
jgi:hypothetical protein